MKRIAALIALGVVALGTAQTPDEYFKARKGFGISQAVGVASLETLMGTRVLEVRGIVKGTMSSNGTSLLLLESASGNPMFVSAKDVPEWLTGNEVHARLLIRANRATEMGEITADLISAAPEHIVRAAEDKVARETEAQARVAAKASPKGRTPPPKPAGTPLKEWNLAPHAATPYYAAFIKQRNKRLSDAEAMRIATGVINFSINYGVDARLIMAMVMVESGFDPGATSRSGAMGLGQLMPGTARGMGVGNPYDSIDNLNGMVKLVRGHLDKYGKQTNASYDSLVLTLAAYNAGSGAVRRAGGVPPFRETQNYVRKVITAYQRLIGTG